MSERPELISDRLAVVLAAIFAAASMVWLWFTPVADRRVAEGITLAIIASIYIGFALAERHAGIDARTERPQRVLPNGTVGPQSASLADDQSRLTQQLQMVRQRRLRDPQCTRQVTRAHSSAVVRGDVLHDPHPRRIRQRFEDCIHENDDR